MRKLFGVVLIIFSGLIALGSVFPLLDMLSKASHVCFEPDFEHKSFFLIGSLLARGERGGKEREEKKEEEKRERVWCYMPHCLFIYICWPKII